MNNKTLAIIGMAGAPFLCLGMTAEMMLPSLFNSRFSGAWGIIYIGAWACTMAAIYRMNVFQQRRVPQIILYMLLGTLTIANVSNVLLLTTGNVNTPLYFYLDLCWPLSNVIMLVLGISLIGNRTIPKKLRYAILATGTWLPLCILSVMLFGKTTAIFVAGGIYSLINWIILGFIVWQLAKQQEEFIVAVSH